MTSDDCVSDPDHDYGLIVMRATVTRSAHACHGHVQQIAAQAAVAHFSTRLTRSCEIGERVTVQYARTQGEIGTVLTAQEVAANKAKAEAFRTLSVKQAVQRFPDLAVAYLAVQEAEHRAAASHPKRAAQVVTSFKEALALQIERGLNLQVKPARTRMPSKRKDEPGHDR